MNESQEPLNFKVGDLVQLGDEFDYDNQGQVKFVSKDYITVKLSGFGEALKFKNNPGFGEYDINKLKIID